MNSLKKQTSILEKWCGKPWLITTYLLGIIILGLTIGFWKNWEIPRKLLAIIAILLPLHIFEENTFPSGFHYMMNIINNFYYMAVNLNYGTLTTMWERKIKEVYEYSCKYL